MANTISLPIQYFPDPNEGRPLFNAQIFIGEPDLDPEIPANQKSVSVRQEDGATVPVSQPVRTGTGGVPIYQGSAAELVTSGNYSIKVLNSQGSQIYYVQNAFEGQPLTNETGTRRYSTVATMVANIGSDMSAGDYVEWSGYYSQNDGGGGQGQLVDAGTPGARPADDGGSVLHVTGGSGGLYVQASFSGPTDVRKFGARLDNSTNDFQAAQNALDATKSCHIPLKSGQTTTWLYVASNTIRPKSDHRLTGDGAGNVIIRGSGNPVVGADSSQNRNEGIRLQGFRVHKEGAGAGIDMSTYHTSNVDDVVVEILGANSTAWY